MENLYRFRELTRQLERRLANINKAECCCCDVSTTQCFMIVEIGRKPGISVKELAQKLDVDKSAISRSLDMLVKKGYVERKISDGDRRWVTIYLLEKGRARFERIEQDMNEEFRKVMNEIPVEHQEMVLQSLKYYIDACDKVENDKQNNK